MRLTLLAFKGLLLLGVACFGGDDKQNGPKPSQVSNNQPDANTSGIAVEDLDATTSDTPGADTDIHAVEQSPVSRPLTEQQLVDEQSIREADELFAKAYADGDAAAAAAYFTPDAEYVDESGNVFEGRDAIQESLAALFADNPGCKLETTVKSIRFISPGVAVEDGTASFTCADHEECVDSNYTAVYVKTDGKWLAASVRDRAPRDLREHREQLRQLSWLEGDWVDEGDDSVVNFSCQSVDNGNFLLRTFTILMAGQEAMSGTQRIGWDPLTGKLRTWIFDSEGAYGEGYWHRHGDDWVLKCTGVTADGETASSTSIYSYINDHTMTWQSVDYEIAGIQQPDSEVFTIVRSGPAPEPSIAADEK